MNIVKRLCHLMVLLIFVGNLIPEAHAQSEDVKEVKKTIQSLFEGMKKSDSAMVAAAFVKSPAMQTVAQNPAGETMIQHGDLEKFKQAVSIPKEQLWDERINSYDINIDGNMASVWTPYEFWVGDTFSHCGVNSFLMVKLGGVWKILSVTDTRRKENCGQKSKMDIKH
ncbi:MAG: nuclear transport factor 2 family protein [Balneolaceae bacterium]|nr:nuclear transport factor 2 family protein [Balneolaceae bacterium]